MRSTAEAEEHGEDICVKKVNLYFKRLNTVFINTEGDGVTISFVHEKYSCGLNTSNVRYKDTVQM
jgi:hypothetical protein